MYIAFEGVVGSGKTTQMKMLEEHLGKKYPGKDILFTREPGGTEIAEDIRTLVQAKTFSEKMSPITAALLYAASRAQLFCAEILPCLCRGGVVISDRSVITSMAYQGYVGGIGIPNILEINWFALCGRLPDVVVFFDLPVEAGLARASDSEGDRWELEGREFFEKVRQGYIETAKLYRSDIDWISIRLFPEDSRESVFEKLLLALEPYLEEAFV